MFCVREWNRGLLVKSVLFTFLAEEVHRPLLVLLNLLWQQRHNDLPRGFWFIAFTVGLWVPERQHLQGLGLYEGSPLLDTIRAAVED